MFRRTPVRALNPFFLRILQQTIVTVGSVVGKSLWDAYKVHSNQIHGQGGPGAGAAASLFAQSQPIPMTQQEACKILGIDAPPGVPVTKEMIKKADENYLKFFAANQAKDGAAGSEYIQSKLYHAHQFIRKAGPNP
uniref:Mitochondrial import inner membrane translocase subunit TIM16 n=1 Tax=Eutreptiella gymnastica TaxID=73025 RepID=A0A6U8D465_9EUGL|mmetsp:Transcript_28276/g.50877  ORF Transcript_28276/g.50877 Transcript_28276/m.50877 type:complete len:136 (+) Transcript_28276:126-533(+)